MDQQKYKTENKILRLSLGGTITFTIFEIIASFVLGSKTVMTDGIFDLFDLLLLLPMFILVPFLYKPVSEKKPYGFSQIESLLVLVKYIVLLIVVINMITNNITVLLHGGHTVNATNVLIYEASLCVGCHDGRLWDRTSSAPPASFPVSSHSDRARAVPRPKR